MRIAFITYEFPPDTGKGGIGTYTFQVASMLGRAGWDVHVFSASQINEGITIEEGIIVHRVFCKTPHEFTKLVCSVFASIHLLHSFEIIESAEIHGNARLIKKQFPDLPMIVRMHAPNWLVENLKKYYLPFSAKARFVLGALRMGKWDAGYWRRYKIEDDADRCFTLLADVITAPSETMKKWTILNWKIAAEKIIVLPNLFTAPNALLNLPVIEKDQQKEVLFWGRLNVVKGLVNATLAMKNILKKYPSYKFTVIGDDGLGPDCKIGMKQWIELQLAPFIHRVRFVDGMPYEALPEFLRNASIVLLPSLFESFSYTCAEAMAAGKAVVGSRDTGMSDMIISKQNGLLADAGNVGEITEALQYLIEHDEERYQMSIKARECIRMKFTEEALSSRYFELYKKCRAADGHN